MTDYICSYCGNHLEKRINKMNCPECGRVADMQRIVVNTDEPDIYEMIPMFGIDD